AAPGAEVEESDDSLGRGRRQRVSTTRAGEFDLQSGAGLPGEKVRKGRRRGGPGLHRDLDGAGVGGIRRKREVSGPLLLSAGLLALADRGPQRLELVGGDHDVLAGAVLKGGAPE